MPQPPLPRGSLIDQTALLFDPSIPDSIKVTLLQLIRLSWGSPAHQTPPLSYDYLQKLTGKPIRTLRGHITALRDHHAALDTLRAEAGHFIVVLAERFFYASNSESSPAAPGGRTRAGPRLKTSFGEYPPVSTVKEEEESLNQTDLNLNFLLLNGRTDRKMAKNRPGQYSQRKAGRQTSSPHSGLGEEIDALLLDAGVFPSLLEEIGASGYSADDLRALLEWCCEDQPDCPAKLLMGRIRKSANAPPRFHQTACPVCGQRGKHAEGCYKRYSDVPE